MRDASAEGRRGGNEQHPTAIRADSATDAYATRRPRFKSGEPDRPSCHCGETLTPCPGCRELRCLWCDPITSDDCRWTM